MPENFLWRVAYNYMTQLTRASYFPLLVKSEVNTVQTS